MRERERVFEINRLELKELAVLTQASKKTKKGLAAGG